MKTTTFIIRFLTGYFILFVICLADISATNNLSNDSYDSIVTTGKQWNVVVGIYHPTYETSILKVGSDTIVDGILQKTLLLTEDSTKTWQHYGTIWEIEKQVFYRNREGSQGLLYDFNAHLGDTVVFGSIEIDMADNLPYVIISEDSVVVNSIKRRRLGLLSVELLTIDKSWVDDYWIEGIGSTSGLLYSCPISDCCTPVLLCAYNGDLIYQDTTWNTCYAIKGRVGVDQIPEVEFNLSPNPADRSFQIALNTSDEMDVTIYDITGAIALQQSAISSDEKINVSALVNGFYVVTISANETVYQTKLVISHY